MLYIDALEVQAVVKLVVKEEQIENENGIRS